MTSDPAGIVLTDAPEPAPQQALPAKCPNGCKAEIAKANPFGTTTPHGVCLECGYEPLELKK